MSEEPVTADLFLCKTQVLSVWANNIIINNHANNIELAIKCKNLTNKINDLNDTFNNFITDRREKTLNKTSWAWPSPIEYLNEAIANKVNDKKIRENISAAIKRNIYADIMRELKIADSIPYPDFYSKMALVALFSTIVHIVYHIPFISIQIAIVTCALWYRSCFKNTLYDRIDNNLEKFFESITNRKCIPLNIKNNATCRLFIEKIDNLPDLPSVENIDELANMMHDITNNISQIQITTNAARSVLFDTKQDIEAKRDKFKFMMIIPHLLIYMLIQGLIISIKTLIVEIIA